MKKTKVKIPAKINLTLDVLGVKDNYHEISSLVTSIALYDTIIVKKRKDNKITLKEKGIKSGCDTQSNLAYKTAKLFMETFNVGGVDITIKKRIPVGGGLGGSSADIAGVIKCMQKLFNVNQDLISLANKLGSDCAYMLTGGLAVMLGRGDRVQTYPFNAKGEMLLLTHNEQVSAKDGYKAFDGLNSAFNPCTDLAVECLSKGDYSGFYKVIKNDLYFGVKNLLPVLSDKIQDVLSLGALVSLMTGSGSVVYGIFEDKRKRDLAYKSLKSKYGKSLIKTKILN